MKIFCFQKSSRLNYNLAQRLSHHTKIIPELLIESLLVKSLYYLIRIYCRKDADANKNMNL